MRLHLKLRKVFRARQERNVFQNPHDVDTLHRYTTRRDDAENLFPHHRLCISINGQRPIHGDKVIRARDIFRRHLDRGLPTHQVPGDPENLIALVLLLRRLQQLHRQR